MAHRRRMFAKSEGAVTGDVLTRLTVRGVAMVDSAAGHFDAKADFREVMLL